MTKYPLSLIVFLAACGGCQPPQSAGGGATVYRPALFDPVSTGAWRSVGRLNVTMMVGSVDGKTSSLLDKFGTAWSVGADVFGRTMLVSAGHVCPDVREIVVADGNNWKVRDATLSFVDQLGVKHDVTEVFDDNDSDVCVVVTHDKIPALALSSRTPVYGDVLTYIGYPAGDLSIVDGRFVGTEQGRFTGVSLNSTGGASGAPVFGADGRVVGMVVLHREDFDGSSFIVPLERLKHQVESQRKAPR